MKRECYKSNMSTHDERSGREPDPLSRREREIMDIIYRLGEASVGDVRDAMSGGPSYSTVRTLVGRLDGKGHLAHRRDGNRYLYRPVVERSVARRSALARVVRNFFGGAPEQAAVALLEMADLDEDKLAELKGLVQAAKEEGR